MTKIIARFIIEVAGKPQEHVDKALNLVLKKIGEEKDKFKFVDGEVVESEFDENSKLFAGMVEASLEFKNSHDLLGFVFDYTPTSIEIEEPVDLEIDALEFAGILNDMSSKLLGSLNTIRRLNATVLHLQKQLDAKKEK